MMKIENFKRKKAMLTEIHGDLFSTDIKVMCHGANTVGLMGAGIAKEFKIRFPKMFVEYQKLCRSGQFILGECFFYETIDGRFIGNLATQDNVGPCASFDGIARSLQKLFKECLARGQTSVAMPRIGCGIGGLNWTDVRNLIEKISNQFNMNVVVYYL